MVIWLAPIVVAILIALAEWLHSRRQKRVAFLAFGARARPFFWVALVPLVRVVATAALTWGLLILIQLDGAPWLSQGFQDRQAKDYHHLVIALDVSPSMQIVDSGPKGDQTRADRARDLLRSVLDRLNRQRTKVSVVAFYSTGRPVVIDTTDAEVIDNILDDLPLAQAFSAGKTNLYEGVKTSAQLAKHWRRNSATLVVASDGDTLPPDQVPDLPASIANTLVLGVGNAQRGTQIDGHSSRQDTDSLRRLALQLRGSYNDGNRKHVRTTDLDRFVEAIPAVARGGIELREIAIYVVLAAAALLALISPMLASIGAPTPENASTYYETQLSRSMS